MLGMQTIKCVIVGDGSMGKSSLLRRYYHNIFNEEDFINGTENYVVDVLHNDKNTKLAIWDTMGGDEYAWMRHLGYPQTDVFIIAISVIEFPRTHEHYWNGWYPEIKRLCPNVPFILVGTKCDLRDRPLERPRCRMSTVAERRELAQKIGAFAYVECSSLSGKNVQLVFQIALNVALTPIPKQKKGNKFFKNLFSKFPNKATPVVNLLDRPLQLGMVAKPLTGKNFSQRCWGQAAVYIPPKMYVFGGAHEGKDQVILEDIIKIFTEEGIVEKDVQAEKFEKRTFATASVFVGPAVAQQNSEYNTYQVVYDPNVLIFGGKSRGYRADVNVFVPDMLQIKPIETTGTRPSPRFAMASVTYNNNIYIMGGYDNNSFICNDLFMLHTGIWKWAKISMHGMPPSARMYHTAICLNDNIMVVYGGKGDNNVILDDMYLINLDTGTSIRCMPEKSPGPRQNHACVALNKEEMVLIGGITKGDVISNDVFVFSMRTKQWTKVNVTGEFAKRELHSAIFTGTEIWVFGGKGENNNTLLPATKLQPDFLTLRFYEALPRYLTLLVLSYLTAPELNRFGQACRITHDFAEDNVLWIQLCKQKDPNYKFIGSNHVTKDKNTKNNNTNNNNNNNNNNNSNNNNSNNNNITNNAPPNTTTSYYENFSTPKKYLESFTSVWTNNFNVPADPVPELTVDV
eukprot:Phypoly_transcript_00096.p2 GENE.Phypoly_transcript_00096~~Phypoly_transcript_00096.p2  ORF type:complete len:684 (+),score=98.45 Phypoly_transcript_00096:4830-6881(+)